MKFDLKSILKTEARVLTFRASREEFTGLDLGHLIFGLFCTWLAGIGRSWDDPKAHLLQHLGVGSVVYVFCLALLLWLFVRPLSRPDYSYREMLTFVCLTSPPALLYAIPVDQFMSVELARNINLTFLAVVAAWRVALLGFYLKRGLGMGYGEVLTAVLTPLSIIMTVLGFLKFQSTVMQVMAGLRSEAPQQDPLEGPLILLGMVSMLAVLPLLVTHQLLSRRRREEWAPKMQEHNSAE